MGVLDAVDRLVRKSYSDGTPAVDYTYDAAGKMLAAASAVDTLSWTYDLLGRTMTESSQRHATTLSYGYDEASNRASLSIDGTLFLEYDYDGLSRLWHVRRGGKVFELGYDELSRRTSLSFPNGVMTTYGFDPNGMSRLTNLDITHGGDTVAQFKYSYDDAGNRTRKETDALAEDYGYDALDRLRSVERPGLARRFGYDAVGNRTAEDVNGNVRTTIYDDSNRLQSRGAGGSVAVAGTVNESAFVTVDGKATRALPGFRFEGEKEVAPGSNPFTVVATDLAGNVTSQAYSLDVPEHSDYQSTYDGNGNLETRHDLDGTVWRYEWDAENRLTRVLRNGVETARFAYDPLGRRVEKVTGGMTTAYIYDGIDVFRERRTEGATTTTATYVHGPGIDEPLARADSISGWRYYHADGLGSIVKLTNDSGAVVHTYQYDAWGNIEVGASEPGYAFTGREWDPETGLYYYRARYYDPKTGRFISEDPIGFAGGDTNLYAYVRSNPGTGTDPHGLLSLTVDPNSPFGRRMAKMTPLERFLFPLDFVMPMSVGVKGAGTAARVCKPSNLPAWRRIGIDMIEIASGHTKDGYRAVQSGIKDLFPEGMSAEAIERAVREAYHYGQKLGSQGERVFVEGVTEAGMTIQMWVNKATKMIETAWPKW